MKNSVFDGETGWTDRVD